MTTSIALPMLDLPADNLERQLGSLLLKRGAQSLALPLQGVEIKAKVIDQISEVTIKQVFKNSHAEHLEAVYIFPMSAGSAISNFSMHVGDRKIKGVIQERAEARRQYQQAMDDGKRAALLEQERDDVFTVQVGNLPPGEEVTIEISYSERLPFYEDGKTELRLPLVVAPRYIPGQELNQNQVGDGVEFDTDLVPDASRISPPRLAKGVDPATALKLTIQILPQDGEISDLACSQHATKTGLSQEGITISLAKINEKLNRDFVLRWTNAGASIKSTLLTYTAEDGETYGLLSVMPPKRAGFLGAPRDVIFVVDRSGSMEGIKMTSAIRACSILLNSLGPQDRFAIAAFDDVVEWMSATSGSHFIASDIAGIEKGETYLRTITARGGTELNNCFVHAFDAIKHRQDANGRMPSLVVLTDGEVGNESEILQRIQTGIGEARLFSVGIDTSVNSGLLKRLANLGGGTATFVEPGVQLEEALASVAREIGSPLVSDLQVENLDLAVDRASLSPSRLPDVFQGRASTTFLKLSGENRKGKLLVKGRHANGKSFEEKVKAQKVDMPAIAQLWAKAHIVDLEDQFRVAQSSIKHRLKNSIIAIAVKHSLLTKFTAFVVVDETEIVNKTGDVHKVVQPVEMPEAWEMEAHRDPMVTGQFAAFGAAQQQQAAQPQRVFNKISQENFFKDAEEQVQAQPMKARSLNRAASGSFPASLAENIPPRPGASAQMGGSTSAPPDSNSDGWGAAPAEADAGAGGWSAASAEAGAGGWLADEKTDSWGAPSAGADASCWGAAPAESKADGGEASYDAGSAWGDVGALSEAAPSFDQISANWEEQAPNSRADSDVSAKREAADDASNIPMASEALTKSLKKKATQDNSAAPPAELITPSSPQPPSQMQAQAPAPQMQPPRPSQAPVPAQAPAASPKAPVPPQSPPQTQQASARPSGSPTPAPSTQPVPRPSAPAAQPTAAQPTAAQPTAAQPTPPAQRQTKARDVQTNAPMTPPVQPPTQPPSTMGSGLGGLFKKLESFGKSLSDRKENDSKQKEDNEPPHEPKTVNDLLRDFLGAFQQAFAMIDKGAKPEIDQLEMKRSKLIQALAPTKFGMECPNLQRFLRSTAVELISSLKSDSVSADDLKSFWDSKLALFEDVQNELETTLSGKEAAFWDSTV